MGKTKQKKRAPAQPSSNGARPQTSNQFVEEMRRLQDLRKAEKDAARRKAMAARHAQIKNEFKSWQNDLCWLIRHKSKVRVRADGSAEYVLPTDLVRLVWQTTITQRVAAEKARNPRATSQEAMASAMDGLSAEVAALAAKVKEAEHASQRPRADQADGASADEPGDEQSDGSAG